MTQAKDAILAGKTALGIEFGSTRIKAVLVGEDNQPIASGAHDWENQLVDGIWTYSLTDIHAGLQACYQDLAACVRETYGLTLTKVGAIGFSAMMHGYMAFDQDDTLLTPFRTWRNTITGPAAAELTELFDYPIPQRWSIAHLYQAILNGEAHVPQIRFLTTLAGYLHWQTTGEKVLGIGEASGMFPIDTGARDWNRAMIGQFDALIAEKGYPWTLAGLLPAVRTAGQSAGTLTAAGARLIDTSGNLCAGIPVCPPEGDAGTGMVATNSVGVRTGNVSAGTSVFGMAVLERPLNKVHQEIDLVTTPAGDPVAMVHCNNCTSDLNAWVGIFGEFAAAFGIKADTNQLFETLYRKALEGDPECGGLLAYNYFSGEHITGFEAGRPLFVRTPESRFNLANFMRAHLFASLGVLKTGMDILLEEEKVQLDEIFGHGGLFKTAGVGQAILAAALNTPVSVMKTAGEGGAWGIAVLASYLINRQEGQPLDDFLRTAVFAEQESTRIQPDPRDVAGFSAFSARYLKGLPIERAALDYLD